MIVLGLGSNVGDRLAHLREALNQLKNTPQIVVKQVSPVYLSDALLPDNAPTEWNQPHLNVAIRIETHLSPDKLLATIKQIETVMGQESKKHWGPRIIDIDILSWHDLILENKNLCIPHRGLLERPFALWPLADVAADWIFPALHKKAALLVEKWGSRFTGNAPLHTKQIPHRIDFPELVGIINGTPDSFSDGGKFLNPDKACEQALALVKAGATILDIGAESTAPHVLPLTQAEEWARLLPILHAIQSSASSFLIKPKISIDTRYPETAEKVLALGVDWINDVTGLENPAMRAIVAKGRVDCVIMHSLSIPASRDYLLPLEADAVQIVYDWGMKRLEMLVSAGIQPKNIIFDPGIGFGKSSTQSLALIKAAALFKKLGVRVLIGHSRKSFLSLFTSHPYRERDIETLAMSLFLAKASVDYLRLHEIEMHAKAFRVTAAF